jgi:S1-C subfamily serine protease
MWWVIGFCTTAVAAQPVAVTPRLQVNFSATAGGQAGESVAVPVDGGPLMVVVVAAGSDPATVKLQLGGRILPVKVIGHDPVSRLGFIQVESGVASKTEWAADASASASADLGYLEAGSPAKCRTNGWVKQVGGKILPLALLRVNFNRAVPPPGTPLTDAAGRVVAVVFQSAGSGNTGYAIPAEAMHRVKRDISSGGKPARGWLGLALRAESQTPIISRVLPDSPAAAAGILPNDVLVAVGPRPINDYADVANAFFYLIPGSPVKVRLLRGAQPLDFTLVPVAPK